MKTQLISKIISVLLLATVSTTLAQRAVMVNSSNSTLTYPTNFWSVNAAAARTGLGLGSSATNESTAFQPSSTVLSNLASSNGVNLTNIQASNLVGTINVSNVPVVTLSNISGVLAITSGGTGATNISAARTNLGLGASWLTNTSESSFRTAIGLSLTNLTNTSVANFRTSLGLGTSDSVAFQGLTAQNVTITAGGGITLQAALTNAGSFRTNIGISLPATLLTNTTVSGIRSELALNWSALTNSNASTALLGYTTNGVVSYGLSGTAPLIFSNSVGNDTRIRLISNIDDSVMNLSVNTISFYASAFGTNFIQLDEQKFVGTTAWTFHNPVAFNNTTNSAVSRTNLGLPFTALTNTNASTFRSAIGLPLAALTNTSNATFRAAVDMPWAGLTNTNDVGIQAAIFTNTNTPPSVTTNFAGWISIKVGTLTNNFRIPVYQ